jgi:hypothetical protein
VLWDRDGELVYGEADPDLKAVDTGREEGADDDEDKTTLGGNVDDL